MLQTSSHIPNLEFKDSRIELIRKQFDAFLKDTTMLERIKRDGHDFYEPYIIIELFRADIRSLMNDLESDAHTHLVSPYAKVLQVGRRCDKWYRKLNPGDIVAINDNMAMQIENPEYRIWMDNRDRDDFIDDGIEPTPYTQRIWDWMIGGFLYVPDKMDLMTDPMFTMFNPRFVYDYDGPMVFKVVQDEIMDKPKRAFDVRVNKRFWIF